MATVEQDTRRMQRELRDLWRVRNFFEREADARYNDSNFHGTAPESFEIRGIYLRIRILLELLEERWRESYRRMRRWSRAYAAIPDVFETPLGPQYTEITRCMATTNRLENAQLDATITAEAFKSDGNRWENLWDFVDCYIDFLICFGARTGGWSRRWEGRGGGARFRRVVAILEDLQAQARAGVSEMQDIAEQINTFKGAGVDELELRENYGIRRQRLGDTGDGGMYALNRGLTTAELGGTTEPQEFVPDIESVRDFPALGTEVQ